MLIDEQIQRFTTAEAVDSFDVYNWYAVQAITAIRAEDRAAFNEVLDAVNREAAGSRLVGGACDVYAGLLEILSRPVDERVSGGLLGGWRVVEFPG